MDVLDFRPAAERGLGRLWRREDAVRGPLRALAGLAGRCHDRAVAARVSGRGHAPDDGLVVSVGNLRAGGTGKTPVVRQLALDLAAAGMSGAVLTRGYGSSAPGPLIVTPDDASAGDEARLLAASLGPVGWTVVQARRRTDGLALLRGGGHGPAVVILDDGHQSAAIGRHLDVVILDRWREEQGTVTPISGLTLPFGPYRETAAGAARAQIWLLERPGPWPQELRGAAAVTGFRRETALHPQGPTAWPPARVALLSGIARPEGFEDDAVRLAGAPVVLAVRCRDHVAYDAAFLRRILAAGRQRRATGWVTTAKDWVKLRAIWPAQVAVAILELSIQWQGAPALPRIVAERRRAREEATD